MALTSNSHRRTGVSLAKGPVGALGVAGISFGVLALLLGGNSFALRVPHGTVGDGHIFGLLTNGWTDLLFIASGVFLALGAPVHWLAKSNALITAAVLGAAALVAVIRGNGVFGLFAANGWTELVWAAAAIVLALAAMLPRVGRGPSVPASHRATPGDVPPATPEAQDHRPLVSSR